MAVTYLKGAGLLPPNGARIAGGTPTNRRKTRRGKPCGKCGARPYEPCQRTVGGKTRDSHEPYQVPMRGLHPERGRDAGTTQ